MHELFTTSTLAFRKRNFVLNDLDSEFGDIIYYSEVRWLSRVKMSKRFFDLKNEISDVHATKRATNS